ncbi:hypothetical protein A2W15_00930 [Candidatus Woesebacteria bacterium RBG_16_41_13]|nr:MAG: hypothetical protein A2W15_00930 [Candidatus Woesebacteria bacterium RBG_16_41_13]
MPSEREIPYSKRERPFAPVGQSFKPLADWNFELKEGSKVFKNAMQEFFIEGVPDHIIAVQLETWKPVGVLIDEGYVQPRVRWTGRYITPNGLVDASGDKDLAIDTLRQNPYHATLHIRRFDVRENPNLKVDAQLLGQNGKVVVNARFGIGMGWHIEESGKNQFGHYTVGTEGFSLPRRRRIYPLVLPQNEEYLRNNFSITVTRKV